MEMRSYLDETIKPKIPSNVLSKLRNIRKTSYYNVKVDDRYQCQTQETTDQVWIPGTEEIHRTFYKKVIYYSGSPYMIKYNVSTGNAVDWWIRDVSNVSVNTNHSITYYGNTSGTSPDYSKGVVLGFCL